MDAWGAKHTSCFFFFLSLMCCMVMRVNIHAHVPWLSYVQVRGQTRSWFSPLPALESRLTRPGLYTKCFSLSRLACLTMSFVVVAIFIIVINVTVDFMVIRFVSNHLNICLNFRWNTCNLQISGFFNFIFSLCVFFCLWYSCKAAPTPSDFVLEAQKEEGGRKRRIALLSCLCGGHQAVLV